MSYETIAQSTEDRALINRLRAAIAKEAWANPALGASPAGQLVQHAGPEPVVLLLIWPTAIDNEAAYAYALGTGHTDPGGDESVITDAALASAVQAHWPQL